MLMGVWLLGNFWGISHRKEVRKIVVKRDYVNGMSRDRKKELFVLKKILKTHQGLQKPLWPF